MFELGLAESRGLFTSFDRRSAELDGAEGATAIVELRLGLLEGGLAGVELGRPDTQLGLAQVELGRAVAKDLFHTVVQLACALLSVLELLDSGADLRRSLLELPAALGDELRYGVGGVRGAEQTTEPTTPVAAGAATGPLLPLALVRCLALHPAPFAGSAGDTSSAVEFE